MYKRQVLIKPSPDNIQDLYLGSLEAIGIDISAHDVRFGGDDWESPTLGAWGLGWEIWIDGMEVTQFTYFQQAVSYTHLDVYKRQHPLRGHGLPVGGAVVARGVPGAGACRLRHVVRCLSLIHI